MRLIIIRSLAATSFAASVIFCLGSSKSSCAHAAFLSPITHSAIPSSSKRPSPVAPLHLKKGGSKKKKVKSNIITVNKLAFRNYEVLEKLEVGVSLVGTEVKSIRDGKMNIRDGFVKANKNGRSCTLMNVHIGKHNTAGEFFNHEERRPRPLLLHKQEARRLLQKTDRTPGMTIVPLRAYWSDGNKVKFEIGLCRGKNVRDKRQDIMARESKREESRMIKNFNVR
uniref:SsrA-binding protein n=1 Tax=Skeletonema marinoi TaxID=267567 RepID=A0A7S2M9P5_9STRA|mmetsp:Transcript_7141/g.11928  ORF Transcript_7141/g.11928 Transcript_7141/m.11928 type:complete len:225 (+) Transcript_7141:60-734(+)